MMAKDEHSKGLPWLKHIVLTASLCLLPAFSVSAANVDYYRDVYPFLKANCLACHNKTTTKAGLDMESPESMRKGGDSGPAIIPGKSRESLIVQASLHQKDMEMPPANNKSGAVKLTSAEISLLKSWIDQGAKSSVQQERQVVFQALAGGNYPIYSAAMTKDGRYAVCGRSNNLFLYDLATRQFVSQILDESLKSGTAHQAQVQSLAFSPDGTRLASGSFREVKIWRQEKIEGFTRPANAKLGLQSTVISNDGTKIIGANEKGGLVVLDAIKGKSIKRISNVNKSGIKLLSISPDGTKVAVWGNDAVLSAWTLKTGKLLISKTDVTGLKVLEWSADSLSLITSSEDKTIRLWSVPTSRDTELVLAKEFKDDASKLTTVISGPTSDQFTAASEDGKVRFWSISKGTMLKELSTPGVLSLALSYDGKQLATGSADGVIRIWDIETGKQQIELKERLSASHQISSLEWTVAAQTLEQTFHKGEIARIEAQNKALDELLKKANATIETMKKVVPEKAKALKPAEEAKAAAQKVVDEVLALIAKAPEGKADATLEKQLKDAQEKLAPVIMAENSAIATVSTAESNLKDAENDVARITDTKAKNRTALEAAKTAVDASKQVLDKATADLAAAKQSLSKPTAKPLSLAFSEDNQRVAAAFDDGTVEVWAVVSGIPIEEIAGPISSTASLARGSNGSFITTLADGATLTTSTKPRWELERVLGQGRDRALFADRVNAVRFSPDGKTLATGGGDPSRAGDVILFDVAKGKVIKTWKERHADSVLSLDFSPDGKLLASGGADKIARVTDIATGEQVNLFEGHTHHVMGVTFRADGRVLASAGADSVVIAWDMTTGERKKKIEGWSKEVTSLQFIGASNQLITSAGDNRVRIINDDGREIRAITKLPDFMQAAASTADASVIIGGGEDSVLRVWDGTNGKELAVFGTQEK